MPQPLFEARGDIVSTGVHPGRANQSIPLWFRSSNFIFKDGGAKIAPSQTLLFTKASSLAGLGVLAVDNAGVKAAVWGDREDLYKGLVQPTTEKITRASGVYTGTDSDLWSIIQFGTNILATNGIDPVQYLSDLTSGLFVDIDTVSDLDPSFRCQHLARLGPFIIALNTNNINTEVRWSDEDDPLTWLPFAANKARDINLRDLGSDITAVVEFGNSSLLAIGRNRINVFQFIGPPFFHGSQKLLTSFGVAGKHSIVADGRFVYGISHNGIWFSDGSVGKYIDNPDIHKFIYEDSLDREKVGESVVWVDPNEQEIYFSYPTLDGRGFTVSYNPELKIWSMHDYRRTAASTGELWESPIIMDTDGNLWIQGLGGGTAISTGNIPIALSDSWSIKTGYGVGGYGEGPYGGELLETDVPPDGIAFAAVSMMFTAVGQPTKNLSSALETSTAFLQTKAIELRQDQFVYFIDKVTSHIRGRSAQTELRLEIWGSESEDPLEDFELLSDIDISRQDPAFDDPPGKRYYYFVWRDTAVGQRYVFNGFEVHGEPGGEEF